MSKVKKYKLLKDLPFAEKGSEYTQENDDRNYYNTNRNFYYTRLHCDIIEQCADWFAPAEELIDNIGINYWFAKYEGLQSEVDTIMEKVFEAARKVNLLDGKNIIRSFTYKTLKHFLNGVNYKDIITNLSSLNNSSGENKMFDEEEYSVNQFKSFQEFEKSTEQPSNDNAFVWDEFLACEFATYRTESVLKSIGREPWSNLHSATIGELYKFKQSKQPLSTPIPDKSVKPPLGLMPMKIWREHRLQDINEAIERYQEVNKEIPKEWIAEKQSLEGWLQPKPIPDNTVDKDWLVEEIKCYGGEIRKLINGSYRIFPNGIGFDFEYLMNRNDSTIHSVRRISDNTIWSESKVTTHGRIERFFISGENMYARHENIGAVVNINDLELPSQPLPTDTDKPLTGDNLLSSESRAFYAGVDGKHKTFTDYKQANLNK